MKIRNLAVSFLFVLLFVHPATAESNFIEVASWNIRNLSDSSRSDAELGIISLIIFRYDFVAIQEVRTNDIALQRIQKILKDDFQADYEIDVSDPVGTTAERYAFIWRTDKITKTGDGWFFDDTQDDFTKEPYCAPFQSGSFDWNMCTVHIKFGRSEADRRPEIQKLDDVYRAVKSRGNERDILICGDFNFDPEDTGWSELKNEDGMSHAISSPHTTTIEDKSLYDNCWWPVASSEVVGDSSAVFEFDELMYPVGSRKEVNRLTSDHRPISIKIMTNIQDDD